MTEFLGWLNVSLLCLSLMPFLLRRFRKHIWKKPNRTLNMVLKHLSKIHPFIGLTLVVTGFLHGYMALGTIRLHTGYITWFTVLILLALRIWGKATKNKNWIKLHRAVAVLFVVFLLIHLFARNII